MAAAVAMRAARALARFFSCSSMYGGRRSRSSQRGLQRPVGSTREEEERVNPGTQVIEVKREATREAARETQTAAAGVEETTKSLSLRKQRRQRHLSLAAGTRVRRHSPSTLCAAAIDGSNR